MAVARRRRLALVRVALGGRAGPLDQETLHGLMNAACAIAGYPTLGAGERAEQLRSSFEFDSCNDDMDAVELEARVVRRDAQNLMCRVVARRPGERDPQTFARGAVSKLIRRS